MIDEMNNYEDLKAHFNIPIFSVAKNGTLKKENKEIHTLLNSVLG